MTAHTRIRKKIERTICKDCKGGSWAEYIQISAKKGIKLFRGRCSSIEELFKSREFEVASNEVKKLKKSRKLYPYIPACYGLKIMRIRDVYKIGIVLQHLGDRRASDNIPSYGHPQYTNISEKIHNDIWTIQTELRRAGINHNDLHTDNVMIFKDRYWPIDFGGVTIL